MLAQGDFHSCVVTRPRVAASSLGQDQGNSTPGNHVYVWGRNGASRRLGLPSEELVVVEPTLLDPYLPFSLDKDPIVDISCGDFCNILCTGSSHRLAANLSTWLAHCVLSSM